MPRIRKRSAYQKMSEFFRSKIVPYQESGLSFRDIAVALADIHPLSCEYRTKRLLNVILKGMQGLNALPWLTPKRTDTL